MEASGDVVAKDRAVPLCPAPLGSQAPALSSSLLEVTQPQNGLGGKGEEMLPCSWGRNGTEPLPGLAQGTRPSTAHVRSQQRLHSLVQNYSITFPNRIAFSRV